MLKDCLEGYGYLELSEEEAKLYDAQSGDQGEQVFCRLFGPEKMVDNTGEFLGYFMSHKVMCGKQLLQASGLLMKELALWLLNTGYIGQDQADLMVEKADDAFHNLPAG